ncbi:MAG: glycosyltransferase family 4 protein [Gaiellaceae bacterium]
MRICIVYDCVYPYTVGGGERWYRELSERLAAAGHEVTYVTLRQWRRGSRPDLAGVNVVAVAPGMRLYAGGRRAIDTQLVFSAATLWHLLRRGGRYDVVQTAAPHLFFLAVLAARRVRRFRVVADWFEVWTPAYWREYLGPVRGRVGRRIQRLCARGEHVAFGLSHLHARRLREEGYRDDPIVLEGTYAGDSAPPAAGEPEPLVVYAGRHIREKQVPALVPAFARARERVPELRCEIYGDGPEREEVIRLVREHSLDGAVATPGFVDRERVEQAFRHALCLVLPSRREGYGLVVIEACAHGTPAVVVDGPDNAALELVEDGVNGVVARSAGPEDLAEAILRVHAEGRALRESTAAWFELNASRLSLESSVGRVLAAYSGR